MARYTADMLIRDVLVSQPEAADVFEGYGLGCASCLAAGMETVQAVASMHDVCVDSLLADLNRLPSQSTSEDQAI